MRPRSLLKAENLIKDYRHRRVVDHVSLNVNRGEIVGLLGPNGAGKTTTFYMIVGLIKATGGRVFFDGHDITHMAMSRRARLGISYLSQEPSIFRHLTVEQNIMAILEIQKLSRRQRRQRLQQLMKELGLDRLAKSKAYTLSGGERRRLEITRALVISPQLILLDEPFSGVDPIAVFDVQQIILELKKRGLGILLTDHNVRETLSITDRSYIMYESKILISGTSEELIKDPKAREIYLGEQFSM
ncbi:MAG: LPS export ABC transporter ATP-binding protein [Euryarchaeota archaeon]|nr:LPS export ABC transporter ATP-binding protein [Euryarchaeota archaeon]